MALLTDQIQATGVSLTDLIHIVITGNTSQNPAGSSFKASILQVAQAISGGTSGTSGTSGSNGSSGSNGTSGSSGGAAWGAFISTDSQYVVSTTTAYSISAATQTSGNGVTVSAGTRFVVASAGTYNLQFSSQLESTGGGSTQTMDIWLAINGNNVSNSNTQVVGNSNNGRAVAAWNFVEPLNAGDYMELKYRVSDVRLGFAYDGPQITPTRPAIPSVIVTVTQV